LRHYEKGSKTYSGGYIWIKHSKMTPIGLFEKVPFAN